MIRAGCEAIYGGSAHGGKIGTKRTSVDALHKEWLKKPAYRREYEALDEEFSLTATLIEARARASLTQG